MTILTELYANNAQTTLANSIGTSDSTLYLAVGTGALFPTPGANQYFLVTIAAGSNVEIIAISGRSGDILTVMTSPTFGRGWEGTSAQSWSVGSACEMRVTAGILGSFVRHQDRLGDLASVDNLTSPYYSDGNSYLCHSNDDGNNPIVALATAYPPVSTTLWGFQGHPCLAVSAGIVGSGTTTSITSTSIGTSLNSYVTGKYIIQFTSNANGNLGLVRYLTAVGTNTATWVTPITTPTSGDTFNIYQSAWSILNAANTASNSAFLYSLLLSRSK